jgi:MarR family
MNPRAGVKMVPGSVLESLALWTRLGRTEWRVLALVLASPEPVTARGLTKRLGISYSPIKRVVRGLVAWHLIQSTPAGLIFESDPARWGPPAEAPGPAREARPGQTIA